jgi:hypothetical protein
MIALVIWLGYVAGFLVCIYPFYQAVTDWLDIGETYSDGPIDYAFGGFLGVGVACLWPIVVVGWFSFKVSKRIWKGARHDHPASAPADH